MKYCPKCKVNVHHQLNNCPLCGSYLDRQNDNDKCAIYQNLDNVVKYPILKEKGRKSFLKSKFNLLLLAILAVCVAVNVLVTPDSLWSAYVAISFALVVCGITEPINHKSKLLKLMRVHMPLFTVVAIAYELVITKGNYAWFTAEYVLPFVYAVAIVTLDFLVIFRRRKDRQVFSTLVYCTVFAIAPQIVMWIARWAGWYQPQTLICFVVFFASLLNLVVTLVMCSRSLKEEIERTLNV